MADTDRRITATPRTHGSPPLTDGLPSWFKRDRPEYIQSGILLSRARMGMTAEQALDELALYAAELLAQCAARASEAVTRMRVGAREQDRAKEVERAPRERLDPVVVARMRGFFDSLSPFEKELIAEARSDPRSAGDAVCDPNSTTGDVLDAIMNADTPALALVSALSAARKIGEAEEREACAKLVEKYARPPAWIATGAANGIAAAIRRRKATE